MQILVSKDEAGRSLRKQLKLLLLSELAACTDLGLKAGKSDAYTDMAMVEIITMQKQASTTGFRFPTPRSFNKGDRLFVLGLLSL